MKVTDVIPLLWRHMLKLSRDPTRIVAIVLL
jgi:hypothetical protein